MARDIIYLILIVFLTFIRDNESAKNLPPYIKPCERYSPDIEQCLLNATEVIKPYLAKGIPELGIVPFDPYIIPEITLQQGSSALNFKAVLKDVIVKGLTNYKFSKFDFNTTTLKSYLQATIQPLTLDGNYSATGRILIAPIEGSGTFHVEIKTCNMSAFQQAKIIQKKGKDFLKGETTTDIEVENPSVTLEGLFGNNEELTNITNKIISDNVNELFQDLKPVIEDLIIQLLEKSLLANLEYAIPYDKLYPVN